MEPEERPDDSYYEIVSPEEELADLQERESDIFQEIADIDRASAVRKKPFLDELKELSARKLQKMHEINDDPEPQQQAKPAGPAYLYWVDSMMFHNQCSVIIAVNLILMGLELGCSACPNHDFYQELETCFLAFYVSELSLHLLYH
ncbi:unnamed protein product [Polarella glacialis]|uniref:Uncharacterized protein n=1 Tax=Polarella glacialis TaxID=89957 RepID=A0A813G3B4_POLGL|nr:unnamed protein product [Polarella glacialis]